MKLADIIRCPLESAPHMIRFSRDGRFAYILYELLNQIEVFSYTLENDQPHFEKVQTITTTTPKEADVCAASGLEVTMDGEYSAVMQVQTPYRFMKLIKRVDVLP